MKKYFIILITLFLFQTVCLYSEFSSIIKISNLYDFYRINNDLIITNYGRLLILDLNTGKIKQHTSFSTNLPLELQFFLFELPNSENIIPENIWIYGEKRFTLISDLNTNPIPTKVISTEEISGMITENNHAHYLDTADYLNGVVIAKTQNELIDNKNIVYIVTNNKLLKVDLDKPDSLLLEVPYSTATDDWQFTQMALNHTKILFNSQDSLLWFTNYFSNQIGLYNISSNLLSVFDYTKLPVNKDFKIHNYYIMPDPYTDNNN
ncbi:MAG: hypothetical protein IJK61_04630, partial [Bacteroidetes bacterium]|nr:hypothetical protein [Bacteroidota bacterium]